MDTDFKIYVPHDMFEPGSFKNFTGTFSVDKISGKVDTYYPCEPIKYNIDLTNTGDAFLLSGTANCKARTNCSRCLEECVVEFSGEVDGYYLMNEPQDDRDAEINEFEVLNAEHEMDAGEKIITSLLIDAPTKPLCNKNCKGICPNCGVNLNQQDCTCGNDGIDPDNPFAALSVLLDDNDE